ncbi:class I SAM-dependent methyltransferase [Micromonospora sp. 15K316]|uniref:class I SAM-dependent methyltransferase n=1 Tax=Micromonospora sp. 15K316 TaxID=2530376 RepID=UPI00104C0BB4|nr:class I SAM-dependent methyltransferase [Micromonospora sp. 15K316]TDC36826.1 class I SAM-dependent methyltransferase [Micromonospora sp. 15K316]
MTTVLSPFALWLGLREGADAAARSGELVDAVRERLPAGPLTIHDLGSGTGSMLRWLAPLLPGPQHWTLYDRDPELLALAAGVAPGCGPDATSAPVTSPLTAADGAAVTVATRCADLTRLTDADLAEADLITASALLDMLTAEEIERVVAACAGRPTLFMISVVGRVRLSPADPLDAEIAGAFNDHQRRSVDGRRLLGPDAVTATVEAFTRHGVPVLTRPSPWRLGAEQAELTAEWFRGWLGAACEQRPELARRAAGYARRRLAEAAAGRLAVLVEHEDLLAG